MPWPSDPAVDTAAGSAANSGNINLYLCGYTTNIANRQIIFYIKYNNNFFVLYYKHHIFEFSMFPFESYADLVKPRPGSGALFFLYENNIR